VITETIDDVPILFYKNLACPCSEMRASNMLRRKFGRGERQADTVHLARATHEHSHGVPIGEHLSLVSFGPCSFIFRIAKVAALSALFLVCCGPEASCAEQPDFGVYARAVEFCRGNVNRPMALAKDKRVLCFDGEISSGQDISLGKDLEEESLFVVRGFGNDVVSAIALADLLRDRRAIVVVYDYCIFACASYLLVASVRTVILKDALVAWRHFGAGSNDCAGFAKAKDEEPPRLEVGLCPDPPFEFRSESEELGPLKNKFYRDRFVDPLFEFPPESFIVRRTLKNLFKGTGEYPNVMWTWNPRYHASAIKTKIVYEAYPNSQSEVDAIAARLHLRYQVIYDP
jgi:hypothetical protein